MDSIFLGICLGSIFFFKLMQINTSLTLISIPTFFVFELKRREGIIGISPGLAENMSSKLFSWMPL
jgi:hypothetical protein